MYDDIIYECAKSCIDALNTKYKLEIDLKIIDELYGMDLLNAIVDCWEEIEENISCLMSMGFGDTVSDICNRYLPSLLEDNHILRENAENLIRDLGEDFVNKLGEDMGLWEVML